MWIKYEQPSMASHAFDDEHVAKVTYDEEGNLYDITHTYVDKYGKQTNVPLENIYITAYAFTDNEPAVDEWIDKQMYNKHVKRNLYTILTAKDINQYENDMNLSDTSSSDDDEPPYTQRRIPPRKRGTQLRF